MEFTDSIEVKELTRHFGSIKAVDKVSFSVKKGEVLGFLGPNGAGKSTTMKMLTCFLAPSSGTASVLGADIIESPIEVKRRIGYLPESAASYPEMCVIDFLRFVADLRELGKTAGPKAIERAIGLCRLEGVLYQDIETLSKGYKRRVSLAQTILHDPPVLIMDEPTDGLDPNQKFEVRNLIGEMSQNKVIILSTHILEEVDAVCSRAIIIAAGQVKFNGTPKELRSMSPLHNTVRMRFNSPLSKSDLEQLSSRSGVSKLTVEDGDENRAKSVLLLPQKGLSISADVTTFARDNGWQLAEVSVQQGRLDDVFRQITIGGAN